MKRLMFFFAILALIGLLYITSIKNGEVLAKFEGDYVVYYVGEYSGDQDVKITKNGSCQILTTDISSRELLLGELRAECVLGESVILSTEKYTLDKVFNILNFNMQTKKMLDNVCVYGGVIAGLNDYVYSSGKRCNVQIACSEKTITIGLPIIFGSY